MIIGTTPKTLESIKPSLVSLGSGFQAIFAILLLILWPFDLFTVPNWLQRPRASEKEERRKKIQNVKALSEQHEVAALLGELIHKDGAGFWPPRANHTGSTWPIALQPYQEIYQQLAPLLSQATPSLDDGVNLARIAEFRLQYRKLLTERIDLGAVKHVGVLSKPVLESVVTYFAIRS
jgi:hypothetical protein